MSTHTRTVDFSRRARQGQATLIGLLVALAIIVILSAGMYKHMAAEHAAPGEAYTPKERAYGAACGVYASQIRQAVIMYRQDNGSYPPNLAALSKYGVTKDITDAPDCKFTYDAPSGTVTDSSPGAPGTSPLAPAPGMRPVVTDPTPYPAAPGPAQPSIAPAPQPGAIPPAAPAGNPGPAMPGGLSPTRNLPGAGGNVPPGLVGGESGQ